jgi:hypothetical protein
MFDLDLDTNDDPEFMGLVSDIITGAVLTQQPDDALVFKIDSWFSHKWLGFSGKTLGALGVWAKPLTVPPFVANRIVGQWHFRRDGATGGYRPDGAGPDIHHRGWAAQNLQRRVRSIVPSSALFWFSGSTLAAGRGSLMAYIPGEKDHRPWFMAFTRSSGWKVTRWKGIHSDQVRRLQGAIRRHRIDEGVQNPGPDVQGLQPRS